MGVDPDALLNAGKGRGRSSATTVGDRRRVTTHFDDGSEMVEEYALATAELLVRKTRERTSLGGEGPWVYEVGEPPRPGFDPTSHVMQENSQNPVFKRQDTAKDFCWRIRNLPYPRETYDVFVDHAEQRIVVRTSNKKYFKKIEVPELRRIGLRIDEDAVKWTWKNNTVIVALAKPEEVLLAERETARERSKLKDEKEECKQQ